MTEDRTMTPGGDRIIVALDVPTEREALGLVDELRDRVGLFKVGLELIHSVGSEIVRKIGAAGGRVFLDCKLHDIPSTVAAASRAVARLGVGMFNVHAMGGSEMMKSAAQAATEEATRIGVSVPLVLGVTVLTSLDQRAMSEELRVSGTVENQVVHLARLAATAGLGGLVASPREARAIRKAVPEISAIVTPGVRPAWAATQDQRRVLTPGEAIREGASYLVIGRPVTKPPQGMGGPADAARAIADEIAAACESMEK
jgi:orotidine-5'-phosphate decarboxylase